jgi:hypothetical protein
MLAIDWKAAAEFWEHNWRTTENNIETSQSSDALEKRIAALEHKPYHARRDTAELMKKAATHEDGYQASATRIHDLHARQTVLCTSARGAALPRAAACCGSPGTPLSVCKWKASSRAGEAEQGHYVVKVMVSLFESRNISGTQLS